METQTKKTELSSTDKIKGVVLEVLLGGCIRNISNGA